MEANVGPGSPAYTLHTGNQSNDTVASGQRELVDHSYNLPTRKGVPWATLKIQSRATAISSLPLFIEGQPITGSIELNLLEETCMKSVSIAVSRLCRVITRFKP